jgi:hypothetical protein
VRKPSGEQLETSALCAAAVSVGLGRIVALCYQPHSFYTRFASIFGTANTKATMRPNPR